MEDFIGMIVKFQLIPNIDLLSFYFIQLTLGGLDEAFRLKNEYRKRYNIPLITENSLDIINRMPPATPPPNPIDIVNDLQQSAVNGTKKSKKVSKIQPNYTTISDQSM